MRKQRLETAAISSVLTFLALLGGLGCMASGLGLETEQSTLITGCALMALSFSFCWNTRLWLLPLSAAALLIGYWWQEETLRLSVEKLLYQLSDLYDRGYGWGILQWTDRNLLGEDTTAALLLLGLPIAATVSLTVTKGRLAWLGALAALLPLFGCVLLKDTVPQEAYLGLLLGAVITLLMTGSVRRFSSHNANTLTLTMALPLTLALALLFTFFPRSGYHGQEGAQKLEDLVLSLFDREEPLLQGEVLIPGDQAKTVDLEGLGRRSASTDTVMTVQAQETGTLYLRGCAYDIYDGTSWSSTPGWNSWSLFYSTNSSAVKALTIRTERIHSVLYFTYTPHAATQKVLGGRMRNEEDLKEYTVYYQDPVVYSEKYDQVEDAVGGEELAEFLQLPDSTRARALEILTKKVGIPTETTNAGRVWQNAMYIADWVSGRARYDLNADKMPASEEDFAMWFLESADRGYCTHYASAAVVLLRAAGIPAQYVTGYLVEAKTGQSVAVTQEDAHAWVEVFINGVGWVVLDPTPSAQTGTLPGTQTAPTSPEATDPVYSVTEPEQTEPAVTEDPAQQTTASSEETVPSQESTTGTTEVSQTVPSAQTQSGEGGLIGPGTTLTPGQRAYSTALLWLLAGVVGLLALLLQWRLRVGLRLWQRRRGSSNRQALTCWKQLSRMHRALRQEPPEQAHGLAQKARFSQHTITERELEAMHRALEEAKQTLRKKNLLLQLYYTLLLALY